MGSNLSGIGLCLLRIAYVSILPGIDTDKWGTPSGDRSLSQRKVALSTSDPEDPEIFGGT